MVTDDGVISKGIYYPDDPANDNGIVDNPEGPGRVYQYEGRNYPVYEEQK